MGEEDFYTLREKSLVLKVKVIANAGRSRVTGVRNGELVVRVNAQPERGKANKELVRLLARELNLSRTEVKLTAGQSSRHKQLVVPGTAEAKLGRLAGGA
jgi:uncharacterized protein (TIGR00251 family)